RERRNPLHTRLPPRTRFPLYLYAVPAVYSSRARRKSNEYSRPHPKLRRDSNLGVVRVSDPLGNGESKPRSVDRAVAAAACGVSAVEALEYVRQLIGGNADARVFDDEHRMLVRRTDANTYAAAAGRELHGVVQEDHDEL